VLVSDYEIITQRGRRRRWPASDKLRIVEETLDETASISIVARRNGVTPKSARMVSFPAIFFQPPSIWQPSAGLLFQAAFANADTPPNSLQRTDHPMTDARQTEVEQHHLPQEAAHSDGPHLRRIGDQYVLDFITGPLAFKGVFAQRSFAGIDQFNHQGAGDVAVIKICTNGIYYDR